MRRSMSVYEQRHEEASRAPTVVVDLARGELLGQLDEHGELVPLDGPPADDPGSWPQSWWEHIGEISR